VPEQLKLVELEQLVQWRMVEGGELTLGPREELPLGALSVFVKEVAGGGELPPDHLLLLSIFSELSFDESIGQLRSRLESSEFEQFLRKLLLHFGGRNINVNASDFKRMLLFASVLFEYAVENLKVELLDSVLVFSEAVGMKHTICEEKFAGLYECATVFDELRRHDYQREEYWASVCEHLTHSYEGDEREDRLEKYRRCLRKLGVSMLEQIKPKKRIFSRLGARPE